MLNVFSPCVYSYFHRQLSDNFILSKITTFGLYEYKVERSGCGFNRNRDLAETDSCFFITYMIWHVLIEPKVYTANCRSFFISALV